MFRHGTGTSFLFWGVSSVVEHLLVKQKVAGPIPVHPAIFHAAIAQSVEHKIENFGVAGSIPARSTTQQHRPDGETGRRNGLKTRGLQWHTGSIPVRDTRYLLTTLWADAILII